MDIKACRVLELLEKEQKFPAVIAKMKSSVSDDVSATDVDLVFAGFTMFSCGDFSEDLLKKVAEDLESILQERATGVKRVSRQVTMEEALGRNPLSCMAFFTQPIARLFQDLFLEAFRSGSGSDGVVYFEWREAPGAA